MSKSSRDAVAAKLSCEVCGAECTKDDVIGVSGLLCFVCAGNAERENIEDSEEP
jgi:hypothetical protein